ncbi:MAG TPA: hypothetical protein VGZ00_10545 [Candidatus Baltobacteraceae bacterium]|jgi:intracellular sulfur oxidation DsrE/DsrF family protein|nr:hypothetical protein [Candidatus Baltobacteraceae bacterium]
MIQRAAFIGSSFALAADIAVASSAKGEPIGLVETTEEFDLAAFTKLVSRSAYVRQVWDAGTLHPQILGGVKSALNGLQFGFGIPPNQIATAFVTHKESNLLLYDDTAWSTYQLGRLFDVKDPTGALVTTNIFAPARSTQTNSDPNDVRGFYQDASISTLQARGVVFFACNTVLVQHAQQIANAGTARNQTPAEVAQQLRKHLLPKVTLVPSGVAAVAYLQSRFHYAYGTQQ